MVRNNTVRLVFGLILVLAFCLSAFGDGVVSVSSEGNNSPPYFVSIVEVNDSLPLQAEPVGLEVALAAHKEKVNSLTEEHLRSSPSGEDEYLVRYAPGFDARVISGLVSDVKGLQVAQIKASSDVVEELLGYEAIDLIELDQDVSVLGEVVLWNVDRVGASSVWSVANGSGVSVGVLDTGIASHADLSVSGGSSVVGGNFSDVHGHGTAMAGIIASQLDGSGLVGVSPAVDLYAVKIMNSSSGHLSDAIAGVQWAIDNDMDVVSMSFGMGSYSQIFKEVLQDAYESGLLLVASAGNSGDEVLYPAGYDSVIAVGATDKNDESTGFSSYGPELELVAPGVDINTTSLSGYEVVEGTSASAAHVAGVAALVWSHNLSLTNEQVRGALQSSAVDLGAEGRDPFYGFGLVQADLDASSGDAMNLPYFFEVSNYTDYGSVNESVEFWLNGTGSIDDLNFSPGWYLIRRLFQGSWDEFDVQVDENGTFSTQDTQITFSDNFNSDRTAFDDGYEWIDAEGSIGIGAEQQLVDEDDAYCLDPDGDDTYSFCRWDDSADNASCYSYSGGLSSPGDNYNNFCNGGGTCTQDSGFTTEHGEDISTIKSQTVKLQWYKNCDNVPTSTPARDNGVEQDTFYVFDKRKSTCISSTQWSAKGRYGSGPDLWKSYNTLTCNASAECDYAIDESEVSTETGDINPCRIKDGSGTCGADSDCVTGLTCNGGTCVSTDTADLEILEIIPIQVVPNVDFVKDKSGFIRVWVKNNGPSNATAKVIVFFDGVELTAHNPISSTEFILDQGNKSFDFRVLPNVEGSKTIIANVTVID